MFFLLFLVVWLHETGAEFLARGTPRTKMPHHSHGVRHSLCLTVSSLVLQAGGEIFLSDCAKAFSGF